MVFNLKNRTNCAFTLLEVLIVMVIIGVMITIVPRWLIKKEPSSELPTVLNEFNDLISFARQEAIANQKNYRLLLRSQINELDFIVVQEEQDDPGKPERKIYKQVDSSYLKTKYFLPSSVKIRAVYLGKKEMFSENKNNAYCYIIPNGLVQDIIIHIVRKVGADEFRATFKMEPFLGIFEYFDGFLKPEK